LVRDGELIFAAGAITHVPLGNRVRARFPSDLIEKAEKVFKKYDENFMFHEYPVEINVDGEPRILSRGSPKVGNYHMCAMHGFLWGIPGTSECIVLLSVGACHVSAAHFSTFLLEGGLEITGWDGE
jgi:hypothetical protein